MLQPNATFIGQIIVFLILLWFIGKVVVPMLAAPINERYKKIADGLAAADAGQAALAAANDRANEIVREARERARLLEDQAQRRSNEAIEAAKQVAQAEGARIVATAQAEAGNEVARVRDALRREFGQLVAQGASKLVERTVDPSAHSQLLEQLGRDITRS